MSPTMPPSQTPTCHSNTAFSAFNGHACLSSLPHGAMVPTQYHMTPYCSATETFGTFSHAFHSAVSPFSACAANGVVNQTDNSFSRQGNGFQGNPYATTHTFTTHTVWISLIITPSCWMSWTVHGFIWSRSDIVIFFVNISLMQLIYLLFDVNTPSFIAVQCKLPHHGGSWTFLILLMIVFV